MGIQQAKIQLNTPPDLHLKIKAMVDREKMDGKKTTLQGKYIELLELGMKALEAV